MEDTTAGGRHERRLPRPKRRDGAGAAGGTASAGDGYGAGPNATSSNGYPAGGNDGHDGGDFSRAKGGFGKGGGKGGRGPHRVQRGRGGDNRNNQEERRRAAKIKQMDNDDSWRARTTEEAQAAIDAMNYQHNLPGAGGRTAPSAAPAPTSQQSPQQRPQPTPEESPERSQTTNTTAFQSFAAAGGVSQVQQGGRGDNRSPDNQRHGKAMDMEDSTEISSPGKSATPPPHVSSGGPAQAPSAAPLPHEQLGISVDTGGIDAMPSPTPPPTPASVVVTTVTQPMTPIRSSLPVKASTKAVNRLTNAKIVKVTTQAAPAPTPQVTTEAPATIPVTSVPAPATPIPPQEVVAPPLANINEAEKKVMQTATDLQWRQVVPHGQFTPAVSSAVAPSTAPIATETSSGATGDEDCPTLLGRGTSPASADADAKPGLVRIQAMDDWMIYLNRERTQAEGEGGSAPCRRAVAPGRGRGRGRLMNVRLERGRGRGTTAGGAAAEAVPAASGGDDGEASPAPNADIEPASSASSAAASPTPAPAAPAAPATTGSPIASPAAASSPTPAPTVAVAGPSVAPAAVGRGSARAGRRGGRGLGRGASSGSPNAEDSSEPVGDSPCNESTTGVAAAFPVTPVGPAPVPPPGPKAWGPPAAAPAPTIPTREIEEPSVQNAAPTTPAPHISSPKSSPRSPASTAAAAVGQAEAAPPVLAETIEAAPVATQEEEAAPVASSASSVPAVASACTGAASPERRAQTATADDASPPGSPSASRGAVPASSSQDSPTPASSSSPRTEAVASTSPPAAVPSAGLPPRKDEVPHENGGWGGGGGWERAFRRDDELLRLCGLWCKKVEADGACLFRAFSDQLEGDGGINHAKYRAQCVTFLEAHRADYAPFVEGNFKGYIAHLREPAEWGGELEAQALCRALGINALIHRPDIASCADDVPAAAVEVMNFAEDARCVQLCFHPRYHAGPHYNSVRCAGDKGEGLPPTSSLVELRERMSEALRLRRQASTLLSCNEAG